MEGMVLLLLLLDFWTILVYGSFDDSSHFVYVNIKIHVLTHTGLPVMISVIEHISKAKIRSYSFTRASHMLYTDTLFFVRDYVFD